MPMVPHKLRCLLYLVVPSDFHIFFGTFAGHCCDPFHRAQAGLTFYSPGPKTLSFSRGLCKLRLLRVQLAAVLGFWGMFCLICAAGLNRLSSREKC